MRTTFLNSFDSFGREGEGDGFLEFRYIDAFLLKVWVLSNHSCRVELGSTSSVGVTPTHN